MTDGLVIELLERAAAAGFEFPRLELSIDPRIGTLDFRFVATRDSGRSRFHLQRLVSVQEMKLARFPLTDRTLEQMALEIEACRP